MPSQEERHSHRSRLYAIRPMTICALLGFFVLISGLAVFVGHRQYNSTLEQALISEKTVATMAATILQEHVEATKGTLLSYASRLMLVEAIKKRDVAGVHVHLADLKKNNPNMDLTFVTDPAGILWANYPVFPEALGADLSPREWYKGISAAWQPYVSPVFKLIVDDKPLAVAVCVPVIDGKGKVIAILANSHRLTFMQKNFDWLRLDLNQTVTVIDQAGHILYSNKGSYTEKVTEYAHYADIEQAGGENRLHLATMDYQDKKDELFLTIAPTEGIGWKVIIERSLGDTLRSQYGNFIRIAIVAALLFLIIATFILFHYFGLRRTAEILQTKLELERSEVRYKQLVEGIPDILYCFANKHYGMFYSPQVESILGYSPEFLQNNPTVWHDSIHPEDLPAVDEALENSLASKKIEITYRIRDSHGQWHWIYDRSVNIKTEEGETTVTGLASDVTGQKALQRQLDKVLHELQIILDTANIGISFMVDRINVRLNRKAIEMFQCPREEMEGRTTREFFARQEEYEKFGREAYPVLARGEVYETEQKMLRRDGTEILVKCNGKAVAPPDMSKGVIWILEDVTERKQTEKALLEAHERLDAIIEMLPDATFAIDASGKVTYWNRAVEEMTGVSKDDMLHKSDYAYAFYGERRRVLADYAISIASGADLEIKDYVMSTRDGDLFQAETFVPRVNQGKGAYLSATCSVMRDSRGTVTGAIESIRDLTDRKQAEEALRESEERLSNAAKAANFGIYSYDFDSGQAYYSPEFLAMHGLPPGSRLEMDEELVPIALHPEDKAEFLAKIKAANDPRASGVFEHTYRIMRSDGQLRWLRMVGKTTFGGSQPGSRPLRANGIIQDITEARKLEEEQSLWEKKKQLLQRAASLSTMAGAVAHHFNNMLAAVIGNLELALEELPQNSEVVEMLSSAIQAANKAAGVSQLMLTYLGQTTRENVPIDLAETCRLCLPLLQAAIPKKISFSFAPATPGLTILASTTQIQQVLTNLVTNAWEAAGENQGSVDLRVTKVSAAEIPVLHRFPVDWQPQDQGYACMAVADTSGGIATEDIDKIFDPFFSSKFTGRGLGLPVTLGIVKNHGGVITVESKAGQGSSFKVFLPLAGQAPLIRPGKPQPQLEAEESYTILLVEDERIIREMVKNMLLRLGHEVLPAADGVEAVEIFQQQRDDIDIVLCDMSMPRMNGLETLSALREIRPTIPVILTSGHDESRTFADAHFAGPQTFLHKPFQKAALIDAIRQAMAGG